MIRAYYEIDVFGKKNRKKVTGKSHSFLLQFIKHLYINFTNLILTITDIDNSGQSQAVNDTYSNIGVTSSALDSSSWVTDAGTLELSDPRPIDEHGLVIGTGSAANDPADYKLGSRIEYGTGGGEMLFYGTWVQNWAVAGSDAQWEVEAIYYNDSGGSITVAEIGTYSTTGDGTFCIVRDKLSASVAVADGEYLKVLYTFKVSA